MLSKPLCQMLWTIEKCIHLIENLTQMRVLFMKAADLNPFYLMIFMVSAIVTFVLTVISIWLFHTSISILTINDAIQMSKTQGVSNSIRNDFISKMSPYFG